MPIGQLHLQFRILERNITARQRSTGVARAVDLLVNRQRHCAPWIGFLGMKRLRARHEGSHSRSGYAPLLIHNYEPRLAHLLWSRVSELNANSLSWRSAMPDGTTNSGREELWLK